MAIQIALGTTVGGVTWASEQATPRPDTSELQEIVVTAEKRESTVQSTAFSLTAISGADLQAQGITNIEQVVQNTPGLSMRTSGPGQTELEMRGLPSSGGAAPTVGYYLNEIPLTPPAAALNGKVVVDPNLFDLSRIEVLRGPQGTLYGAGSMGGTVKVVTNSPKLHEFEAAAEGSFSGTHGGGFNRAGNAMVNIPIGEALALRIVATESYTSGWIDRVVVNPFPIGPGGTCGWAICTRGNVQAGPITEVVPNTNWNHLYSGRASLLIQPADGIRIEPLVMYQSLSAGGFSEFDSPPATLAHYQPSNQEEPVSDRFYVFALTMNFDLPFAQLTSATSYYSRKEAQKQDDQEGTMDYITSFYPPGTPNFASPLFTQETDSTIQRSQEIRLTSIGESAWQWLAGGFYSGFQSIYDSDLRSAYYASQSVGGAAANPAGIIYQAHNPYSVRQYAVFGETSYKISDALKATLGLRWFKYDTNVNFENAGFAATSGNATPAYGFVESSASGFNPKVNLGYEPTRDLTIYGQVAKGFRPGGVNLPVGALCGPNVPTSYSPDSIWNYEVGEKARFAEGKLSINADVYYIKWHNVQQVLTIPVCGFTYNANAGDAKSYGPELEITGRPIQNLTVALHGTYTHAYISSVQPGVQGFLLASNQPIQPGTPLESVPRYAVGGSINYDYHLSDRFKLTSRFEDNYVGYQYDLAYLFQQLPGYNLMNIRIGLEGEHWRGAAFVNNLTDKVAWLSVNTQAVGINIPPLMRVSTNQPRTAGVDLNYRF